MSVALGRRNLNEEVEAVGKVAQMSWREMKEGCKIADRWFTVCASEMYREVFHAKTVSISSLRRLLFKMVRYM